jgi:molybdopterin converting factor small subunit
MIVEVQLWSYLVEYAPAGHKRFNMEVGTEANIGLLLSTLEIPPEEQKVVLVNGRQATDQTPLADGDEVIVFPAIAGG